MNNVKSFAVATDGSGKRIAITLDVVDEETGKVTNSNKKTNRLVVDDEVLEAIKVIENYAQGVVDAE